LCVKYNSATVKYSDHKIFPQD